MKLKNLLEVTIKPPQSSSGGLRYFASQLLNFYQTIYGDKRFDASFKQKVYDVIPKSSDNQYQYDEVDSGEMIVKIHDLKQLIHQNKKYIPSTVLNDIIKTLDDGVDYFSVNHFTNMRNKADKVFEIKNLVNEITVTPGVIDEKEFLNDNIGEIFNSIFSGADDEGSININNLYVDDYKGKQKGKNFILKSKNKRDFIPGLLLSVNTPVSAPGESLDDGGVITISGIKVFWDTFDY